MITRILSVVAIILCSAVEPSWALKCSSLEMTSDDIERMDALFIGQAVNPDGSIKKKYRPSVGEKPSVETEKQKSVSMKVTRAWKGVKEGEIITIFADKKWGDNYQIGDEYLMGAEKDTQGKLNVALCGLSFHYPSYKQRTKEHYRFFGKDQLKAIKEYFEE